MKKILLVIYLTMLTGFSLSAQTHSQMDLPLQIINLDEARVLALANSRPLQRFEMEIRRSILDERNQLYTMLPQISAGYSASMNFMRDWEFVNPVDTLSLGADFSITQIIFQGGQTFIQRAINKISTESIRKNALAEYFDVLDAVDNAYYAVLESAATLEAEESSLQTAILGLSIAEIRHANGMINIGDYLRALAEKEMRENSRNQARRNLTMNMNRFKALTGITEAVELEPIDFNIYETVIMRLASISDEDADLLFAAFWNLLVSSNPTLANAALSAQSAELNLTNTRRDFSPTISATLFSTDISFLPSYNATSRSGVAIRGSIPIDFWVLNDRIERSRIGRDIANLNFTNTEISLEQELQNALFNLFSQAGSVLSARRSLQYTERLFESVVERYRLGQSSVSDLTEATTLFINSRNSYTRASYGFLQNLSRLRSLCALGDKGQLLEILLQ